MKQLLSILRDLALDYADNAASAALEHASKLRCAIACDRHSYEALRRRNEELRRELETERLCNRVERAEVQRANGRRLYS